MGNFLGVHHINILTGDMEKSVRFYTELMGFSVAGRRRVEGVKLISLSLDGFLLELKESEEDAAGRDGVVDHLAIGVADIFAAFEMLKNQGIELISPEPRLIGPGEYILFLRGPAGEKIELISRH